MPFVRAGDADPRAGVGGPRVSRPYPQIGKNDRLTRERCFGIEAHLRHPPAAMLYWLPMKTLSALALACGLLPEAETPGGLRRREEEAGGK